MTGQKLQSLAAARGRAVWSPGGKVLAYASAPEEGLTPCRWPTTTDSWQVHLLDISTGTDRSITSVQAGCHAGGPDLVWSPDGRFLAICEVCKLGL